MHAGGGSSAREPAWHTTPLPPKLSPQQQQARMHRNDTDEDPRRPGVPPSKGGTSVSSGTGIFVDGAKDGEGTPLSCTPLRNNIFYMF